VRLRWVAQGAQVGRAEDPPVSKCHYRPHLRGAALSIYEFAVAASRGTGVFYASVQACVRATGYCHNTVTATLKRLCARGWFASIGSRRDGGGHFQPNRYRVVLHAEWAVAHPGQCDAIVRGTKTVPRPWHKNCATEKKPQKQSQGQSYVSQKIGGLVGQPGNVTVAQFLGHKLEHTVSKKQLERKLDRVSQLPGNGYSTIDGLTWKNFADHMTFSDEVERLLQGCGCARRRSN